MKSKGLNAYLVSSLEGFYLFGEDLLEGRLVGRNWNTCLSNLRSHPVAFEGDEVLRAERTPGPDPMFTDKTDGRLLAEQDMTNVNDVGTNGKMDMD